MVELKLWTLGHPILWLNVQRALMLLAVIALAGVCAHFKNRRRKRRGWS